ncbi:hypothetical protein BGS_0231 [Beggiatoa sp. SS]|nr:hypothetical protein BGS_0231 [Beggiatoa sp. SS]
MVSMLNRLLFSQAGIDISKHLSQQSFISISIFDSGPKVLTVS